MTTEFTPPSLDRLHEVDLADISEFHEGLVEVEGVVSSESQGGWGHDEMDCGVHNFTFAAWRRPGQEIVQQKMLVLRPVDPDGEWYDEFKELTLHRIHVLLYKDESRAIFAGYSDEKVDTSQLEDIATELKKPVYLETTRFGTLTLDRRLETFEGETQWNGQTIQLTLGSSDSTEVQQCLATAEQLWADEVAWKQKVDDYAVRELLNAKNDVWLDDDEDPITADEFKSRMTLDAITIEPDGEFTFWHNDGDLFWGHSIEISGSLKDGLQHADTPG
ncbi:DUF2262 domain-containing protein [Bremerella sp. JC770]|uniref:DUF2262 domain-containing protein n=1 Tax=Bremerella sp. JC770 TaxID=3232137 RepID=UPI00345A63FD